jgi:cell wall-associated NlpC family hydrolase
MSALDPRERTAALLEALLADPLSRAAFHRSPAKTYRDFDLPELAADLQPGAPGTSPLEVRESRSSLAGTMIAAAAEAIGLVELAVESAAQHGPDAGIEVPVERAGGGRSPVPSVEPHAPPVAEPERRVDARRDSASPAREPVARERGHAAQTGSEQSRSKIAAWMARRASAAGIPPELPVMAALSQSSLTDQPSDRQDAAGYFDMSVEAWDRGPYEGFAEDPDLQLAWFLDRAAVVRAERVAAGDSAYGQDPSSWHQWISAAVERPDALHARDEGGLDAAQRLLEAAQPSAEQLPDRSAAAGRAVQIAERYLGQPYRWGGATPETGFDCSGLVQYAYGQAGVALPRVTHQQFLVGDPVSREALRSGDIVFFRDATGYIHHEGLFLGDGRFLHAPRTGDVVKVSSLDEPYYAQQFAGGRRVGQLADAAGRDS